MKKCVLILDDDAEILMVCKIILEQKNYVVHTRLFCDDIIKDIKAVNPHVILMDLWIPRIGGESALQLMKGNGATRNIPVILFSANDTIEEICKRSGADGYLKKPFSVKNLVHLVEKIISKNK